MEEKKILRGVPSINSLIENPALAEYKSIFGRDIVLMIIRREVLKVKNLSTERGFDHTLLHQILESVEDGLKKLFSPSLKSVINATGVILNTNLGRAPLGTFALEYIIENCKGYSNLEFDLTIGERGKRNQHFKKFVDILPNCDAITVVNNNAAAIFLTLCALGQGKEVLVSRGELIEIGGGFRIPEILQLSGAQLVEVGSTNKTRQSDYEKAISPQTKIILKTHQSNFTIKGFYEETKIKELKQVANKNGLILIYDLGSGLLFNNSFFDEKEEPSVFSALRDGADLVLFSGDKLLGGPQCGIIVGNKHLVEQLESHPLMRTYRVCKLTISALEAAFLTHYQSQKQLSEKLPLYRFLSRSDSKLRSMVEYLCNILIAKTKGSGFKFTILKSKGVCGGGTTPDKSFPSYELIISHDKFYSDDLYRILLSQDKPIVGLLRQGNLIINLFCVEEPDVEYIGNKISQLVCDISSLEPPAI